MAISIRRSRRVVGAGTRCGGGCSAQDDSATGIRAAIDGPVRAGELVPQNSPADRLAMKFLEMPKEQTNQK
jgi:hypothetical protein